MAFSLSTLPDAVISYVALVCVVLMHVIICVYLYARGIRSKFLPPDNEISDSMESFHVNLYKKKKKKFTKINKRRKKELETFHGTYQSKHWFKSKMPLFIACYRIKYSVWINNCTILGKNYYEVTDNKLYESIFRPHYATIRSSTAVCGTRTCRCNFLQQPCVIYHLSAHTFHLANNRLHNGVECPRTRLHANANTVVCIYSLTFLFARIIIFIAPICRLTETNDRKLLEVMKRGFENGRSYSSWPR